MTNFKRNVIIILVDRISKHPSASQGAGGHIFSTGHLQVLSDLILCYPGLVFTSGLWQCEFTLIVDIRVLSSYDKRAALVHKAETWHLTVWPCHDDELDWVCAA